MTKRLPQNRRSWLFIPGADEPQLTRAAACGADVLIQELEDFTPPERRPEARALGPDLMRQWREAGHVAAVRINPLESCGSTDLEALMPGQPDVVLMAMVSSAEQVRALDEAIGRHERALEWPLGSTEIVPNIETARGLVRAGEIASASPRVTAMLLATEDMVSDLGGERTPDSRELNYIRSRFLVECVAAGVVAIDCPYTYREISHLEADTRFAKNLGYKAKSLVNLDHLKTINELLTPSDLEVVQARAVVQAFEAARAQGLERADVGGLMVEVPTYKAAQRVLKRHEDLRS